jgi:hypothetical protein
MNRLDVGDKVVLLRVIRRAEAYCDKYGIVHDARVILEVVDAEVVERRDVEAGGYEEGIYNGLRFKDSKGREFFWNWLPNSCHCGESLDMPPEDRPRDPSDETKIGEWTLQIMERYKPKGYGVPYIMENGDIPVYCTSRQYY